MIPKDLDVSGRVEQISLDELIPYARNSRTHSDLQIAQLAASIKEWGWTQPILVDESGMIIAGHGRVLAARKLGVESVTAIVAEGWTETQKRAYVLADNKLAANAGWDPELLALEFEELEAADFNVVLTGFDDEEIAALTSLDEPDDDSASEDDSSETDYKCPKCSHEWSGKPR